MFWRRKRRAAQRHSGPGLRVAIAAALSVAALAVFGAFGGLVYASDAVSKATGLKLPGASKSVTAQHGTKAKGEGQHGQKAKGEGDEGEGDEGKGDEGDE